MSELVSRQAATSTAPVAMQAQTDALMVRAKMIAQAPRDMLPKHYQGNPGACLMAVDWADRNNVGILEALGEVAFVHGKPVVSAVMQRKLAARAGYTTLLLESTPSRATVGVYGAGMQKYGEATYTIEMADALGINKGQVWKADPAHMLILRATTRALMYYGPADLAVNAVDEGAPPADEPAQETPQEPPGEPVDNDTGEVVEAAVDADSVAPIDAATIRAAAKSRKVSIVALCKQWNVATIDSLAGDQELAHQVLDWIETQ